MTIVTRKLLEHWQNREVLQLPFYFCQLEAIEALIRSIEGAETFIWVAEAAPAHRQHGHRPCQKNFA